jgi:hypothetical protein
MTDIVKAKMMGKPSCTISTEVSSVRCPGFDYLGLRQMRRCPKLLVHLTILFFSQQGLKKGQGFGG